MYDNQEDQEKYEMFLDDVEDYSIMFEIVGDIHKNEDDIKKVFGGENWMYALTRSVEHEQTVKDEIEKHAKEFNVRGVYRGDNILKGGEGSSDAYDAGLRSLHGKSSITSKNKFFIIEVSRKVF